MLLGDAREHVVHGDDEEAGRTAGGIENELPRLRIEDLYGHAARVARREELATVTAEVRSHNLLVRHALDVDRRFEERIALQLRGDVRDRLWLEFDAIGLLE